MNEGMVVEIGRNLIWTALEIVGPVMIVGFIVGITVSLFQAIMQMQEMTIAFVPKLAAIGLALVLFAHWMLNRLVAFSQQYLGGFGQMIGL